MTSHYYNENNPELAAWLRELMADGLIPAGEVDERSVVDVRPGDLDGYVQCHFFAGVGGWAYALRLAGWSEDRPVWTGSCPCQPFSAAGKRKGVDDERHLWPDWRWLIDQCRPVTVFGEQVASPEGRAWYSGIRADLDLLGYATGATDLCAAGVGAPHVRQRIFWVADAGRVSHEPNGFNMGNAPEEGAVEARKQRVRADSGNGGPAYGLADHDNNGRGAAVQRGGVATVRGSRAGERARNGSERGGAAYGLGDEPGGGQRISGSAPRKGGQPDQSGASCGLGDSQRTGLEGQRRDGAGGDEPGRHGAAQDRPVAASGGAGFWDRFGIAYLRDGTARRVEPGTFPLVDGLPDRVVPGGDPGASEALATAEARRMRLHGYGNAIVPQVAARFVRAVAMKAVDIQRRQHPPLTPWPTPGAP